MSPIFLYQSVDSEGVPTHHVVDGKQRLLSIFEFTDDKVRIPKDFSDNRLAGKKWSELKPKDRTRLWSYEITVEHLPSVDDATVKIVFERINKNNIKLHPQELRHSKYSGWFISHVEQEAENSDWKELAIATTARVKRMGEVQFISELMAVILKRNLLSFDQNELDQLYADYDDIEYPPYDFSEDDFTTEFDATRDFLKSMVAVEPVILSQIKGLANFYSLWTYLVLEKNLDTTPEILAPLYKSFILRVSDMIDRIKAGQALTEISDDLDTHAANYAVNTRGATTDLAYAAKATNTMLNRSLESCRLTGECVWVTNN